MDIFNQKLSCKLMAQLFSCYWYHLSDALIPLGKPCWFTLTDRTHQHFYFCKLCWWRKFMFFFMFTEYLILVVGEGKFGEVLTRAKWNFFFCSEFYSFLGWPDQVRYQMKQSSVALLACKKCKVWKYKRKKFHMQCWYKSHQIENLKEYGPKV